MCLLPNRLLNCVFMMMQVVLLHNMLLLYYIGLRGWWQRTDRRACECYLNHVAGNCASADWEEWSWSVSSWCFDLAVQRWAMVDQRVHRPPACHSKLHSRYNLHWQITTSRRRCMIAGNDMCPRWLTQLAHTHTEREREREREHVSASQVPTWFYTALQT